MIDILKLKMSWSIYDWARNGASQCKIISTLRHFSAVEEKVEKTKCCISSSGLDEYTEYTRENMQK